MEQIRRCEWAGPDQIYIDYHDNEWGQPLHDDNKLFEMLILEGMQAGLAWITVLKKREAFRAAFDKFDPQKVALYDDAKVEALMADAGIIRHRGKINAAIGNARAFLEIQKEYGSFDRFIWAYVGGYPQIPFPNCKRSLRPIECFAPVIVRAWPGSPCRSSRWRKMPLCVSRSLLRLRRRSPARRRHRGQGDFPLQARKMYICAMLAALPPEAAGSCPASGGAVFKRKD